MGWHMDVGGESGWKFVKIKNPLKLCLPVMKDWFFFGGPGNRGPTLEGGGCWIPRIFLEITYRPAAVV